MKCTAKFFRLVSSICVEQESGENPQVYGNRPTALP